MESNSAIEQSKDDKIFYVKLSCIQTAIQMGEKDPLAKAKEIFEWISGGIDAK